MTREVRVMKLLVGSERVGDTVLWGARIPEINLFAAGESRDEVIDLARESVLIEYPEMVDLIEIADDPDDADPSG